MNTQLLKRYTENHQAELNAYEKLPNKINIVKEMIEHKLVNNPMVIKDFEESNPWESTTIWEHSYREAYYLLAEFTGVDVYELQEIDKNKCSKLKRLETMGYMALLMSVLS